MQNELFNRDEFASWYDHWRGMPEFVMEDKSPHRQIIISFPDAAAVREFSDMIGQNITERTRSLWYPVQDREGIADKRYRDRAFPVDLPVDRENVEPDDEIVDELNEANDLNTEGEANVDGDTIEETV